MNDLMSEKIGAAGVITLNRPKALNALTYDMCLSIENCLLDWANDDEIKLLILRANGDRAFCAGGDISDIYWKAKDGDFKFGQTFWRDEYRMNALMFEFPKPVVSFLQGFTMGGGVGIGCHGSHRIVCETSQISMPEVGIGLVPDVGGSLILANAPGRLGEYLGTTGARMNADDAILAGFADYFVPHSEWNALIETLCETGDWTAIDAAAKPAPAGTLAPILDEINRHFAGETFGDIRRSLQADSSDFAKDTLTRLRRNSPLSMACSVETTHRLRGTNDIRKALELEYRYTFRALEHSDFLEGIRAAIIDKDRTPNWQQAFDASLSLDTSKMLMPLGANTLTFEREA